MSACPATPVHAAVPPPPAWVQAGPPWVEAERGSLYGFLFYYRPDDPRRLRIWSGGRHGDLNMKILWVAQGRHAAGKATLTGKRLDRVGSFRQTLAPALGGSATRRQFPSIVDVPSPGCWRLTIRAGKLHGSVTVRAVRGS